MKCIKKKRIFFENFDFEAVTCNTRELFIEKKNLRKSNLPKIIAIVNRER